MRQYALALSLACLILAAHAAQAATAISSQETTTPAVGTEPAAQSAPVTPAPAKQAKVEPSPQAEPPKPGLVPDDFVLGFHNRNTTQPGVSTILLEYVPKGETVVNWTEMVTILFTLFEGGTPVPPEAQAMLVAELWRSSCQGGKAEVVRYSTQPGSQVGVRAECPKSPQTGRSEKVFMKFHLYGSSGEGKYVLANVQRAVAGSKPKRTMDYLQKWVEEARDFNPKQ